MTIEKVRYCIRLLFLLFIIPFPLPSAAGSIQITGVTSELGDNPKPGETFRFTVDAVGPEGATLHYRFFSRAGYDLIGEGWGGTKWEPVQDFSPVDSADYTLPDPGH